MANILGKDPYSYQKEYASFLLDVKRFHDLRCSPFRSIRRIGGKEIDLYLLYTKVTSLGGWLKVNENQKWTEILESFNIPVSCSNASQALKQIYLRYLEGYEKLNFLGIDPNQRHEFDDDDRPRKKSVSSILTVPMYYNYRQHHVADNVRVTHGLSTRFCVVRDYDKLEQSLLCGLPNEVDFAVNVCTLLSNEGKHTMKLNKSNKLVDLLMAHVGIFAEGVKTKSDSSKDLPPSSAGPGSLIEFHHLWKKTSNRDFLQFWLDAVDDKQLLELLSPSGAFKIRDHTKEVVGEGVFNLGRSAGMNDIEGQRVLQMASIIRNLSFEEANSSVLASHHLIFRFLLLCAHCKFASLRQMGLDTLGNLALQMVLDPIDCWTSQLVIQTICRCMASEDKFSVISAMEILAKLCQVVANEDILAENLDLKVYEDIVSMLTILDIQLIVHTLEVLYQLSELGEMTTTHISMAESSVDMLVSLVTVEAQSYGQNALIGIKVVEHAPPRAEVVQPLPTLNRTTQPAMRPPTLRGNSLQSVQFMPQRQTQRLNNSLNQDTESETFAGNWLRAHLEPYIGYSVSRVELYNSYLAVCKYHNVTGVISTTDFTRVVRSIFSNSECVKLDKSNGMAEMHFKGVRRRPVPLQFPLPTGHGQMVRSQPVLNRPPVSASPQMTPPMSPSAPRYPSPLPSSPQRPSSTASSDSRSSLVQGQLQTPPKSSNQLMETSPLRASPTTGNHTLSRDTTLVRTLLASKVTQNLQNARMQQCASTPPSSSTASVTIHPAVFQNTPHTAGPLQYPANQIHTVSPQGLSTTMSSSSQPDNSNLYNSSSHTLSPTPPPLQSQISSNNNNRKRRNSSPTQPISSKSKSVRTNSPSPSASPVHGPLSPRGCMLEVCGDVERAQDIVKNDEQVHETKIERVENQCSPQFVGSNNFAESNKQIANTNCAVNSENVDAVQSEIVSTNDMDSAAKTSVNTSSKVKDNNKISQCAAESQTSLPLNGDINKSELQKLHLSDMKNNPVCGVKLLENDLLSKHVEKEKSLEQVLNKVSPRMEKKILNGLANHFENGTCHHHITADVSILPCTIKEQQVTLKDSQQKFHKEIPEENDSKVIVRSNGPIVENGYMSDSDDVDGSIHNDEDDHGDDVDDENESVSNKKLPPSNVNCYSSITVNFDDKVVNNVEKSVSSVKPSQYNDINGAMRTDSNCDNEPLENGDDDKDCTRLNGETNIEISSQEQMDVDQLINNTAKGIKCCNSVNMLTTNPSTANPSTKSNQIPSDLKTNMACSQPQISVNSESTLCGSSTMMMSGTSSESDTCSLPKVEKLDTLVENLKPASAIVVTSNIRQIVADNIPNSPGAKLDQLHAALNSPSLGQLQTATASLSTNLDQLQSTSSKMDKTTLSKGKKSKTSRSRAGSIDSRRSSSQSVSSSIGPEYVCEWNSCKKCFDSPKQVFVHAFKNHLQMYPGGLCKWDYCDSLKRQKYSLITHVQDRHCTEQTLKAAAVRRQQVQQTGVAPPTSNLPPMPPPVYPPDAALQAIRRFSAKPPYQELLDAKEGPVTKHIRLTSSLILRNLARFSSHGRSMIKRHEHHLTSVALSGVESSTAISNCLWELHQHH